LQARRIKFDCTYCIDFNALCDHIVAILIAHSLSTVLYSYSLRSLQRFRSVRPRIW
jgi:hypothetical protein